MRTQRTAVWAFSLCSIALASACASSNRETSTDPNGENPELTAMSADASNSGGSGSTSGSNAGSQAGDQAGFLDDQAKLLSLQEQARVVLLDQHLSKARQLRNQLRLEEARASVAAALSIDPDNIKAKALFSEIAALMGDSVDQLPNISEELARQHELRVQQLRAEANHSFDKGKLLVARREYDAAITEFSLCLDYIRWAPFSMDWEGLGEAAERERAAAIALREAESDAKRQETDRITRERLRAKELELEKQRQSVLATILSKAIDAYNLSDFEESEMLAKKALLLDPHNSKAIDIRDLSFRRGREQVRDDFLARKHEQYKVWQESLDELRIPYTGVITLPDPEKWLETTDLRRKRSSLDQETTVSDAELELRQQLATTRIPGLVMEETESLTEVIDTLRTLTGLPLVVDPLADAAAFDEGAVYDFALQNPLAVDKVLDLITSMSGPEVAWTIRHDAVLLTTREKVRGDLILHDHDVQDLLFGLTDFYGPRIDRLRLLNELEDDDGGGPFGGIGERLRIIEADQLTSLVTDSIAKDSWEEDRVSIEIYDGNMIVVQTRENQKLVKQFLEDLRRFSSSMVTIESKFMTIEDNWLQEIGVEFRGLDNPNDPFTDLDDVDNGLEDNAGLGLDNGGTGVANNASGSPSAGFFFDDGEDGDFKGSTSNIFGDVLGETLSNIGGLTAQWSILDDAQISTIIRMVEKSSQIELINEQMLSVQNTQRAYVTVVNQRAYVQDFDVEVAQFEAIADPQINVLHEGVVLDVRPTIHHSRQYLRLEIQPTVANVVNLRNFATSLGSNTSPVEFQLPELQVQSVFTTAFVPDGGSILIGGLSRIRNIERRAEVPWLANIPVVGILFKEEGYSDEKKSLMVMIRAWITDVREELGKLDNR